MSNKNEIYVIKTDLIASPHEIPKQIVKKNIYYRQN
jgi:hypothetical protein